ncbi:MAG: hypothetical protein HC788_01540 [Sphingopyxis sp.]|nr:hypothetical protein [Sphingopyxis sp.]
MRHHGAIWDLIYLFWVGYMGETRRFPSYDCPAIIRHDLLSQCYHKLIENVKEMAEFRHSSPKPITLAPRHPIRCTVDALDIFREALPREISGSTQEVSFSILHAP